MKRLYDRLRGITSIKAVIANADAFLRPGWAAAAAALALADGGCGGTAVAGSPPQQPGFVAGESKALGAGTAFAWVRTDARGEAASIGVSFNDAALTQLGTAPTEIVLPLPPERNLSVRTAVIDWNPHGHPPAHVYDVPHFDFHFYTIDETTRMAIAGSAPGAAPTAAPDLVPTGFRTDGATVPMMGMHYISGQAPEFNGGAFRATPIYGYSNGHLAFAETMIALDYLLGHPTLSSALPQPARFEQRGMYPTQWSAKYDAAAHRYDIAFSGLALR